MRLRPGSWRLRAAWWTHVVVAAGLGLFSSGLAVLVGLVLLVDAVTVPACEVASPAPPDFAAPPFAYDPEARAQAFVQAMANDDFRSAYEMLASEQWGTDTLCAYTVEAFWQELAGDGDARLVAVDQFNQPTFAAMFNRLDLPLQLTLQTAGGTRQVHIEVRLLADRRIAGYQVNRVMTEAGLAREYPPPPYAESDALEEVEVLVGEEPWELKGILTVPRGAATFPAVVLVGAGDHDGTGANTKVFRDIAWGLAAEGVASLRFDQRSYAHALAAAQQADFTIDHELVDDVLAAIRLLRQTPRIDLGRIYVWGGSHGGFAAPRIAERDPTIAGLIVSAAPSGTLHSFVPRQIHHLLGIDGEMTQSERSWLAAAEARAEVIDAWLSGQEAPFDAFVHRSFYAHLGTYRPEVTASNLKIPLLILSVELDHIVPPEDAETWIESLRHQSNVAFRLYRGHDHALMDVRGRTESGSGAGEHASWDVIADVATWIHGQWPDRWCSDQEDWYAGCRGG